MNAPLLPGRIEHWPLVRLKPYARNAKTHDADQVAKIAASMAEFGWTVPVLVATDGELIAGHGRVLAAAHLGLTEAPVIILGHLTEAQRRAYRIADNKLTELGGWDEALLLQELQALLAGDFDLGLIGIPEDELEALLADADDRPTISDDDADAIPEPPAVPITKPGDIWALGKHRLCCGDATDPATVARLMQGKQATLMFTSPPYAQQRDYGAAKEKVGDWDALMQGVFTAAPVTAEAQLLVNLGLVHRDSEWQPIGKDGSNGCAPLAGDGLVGMCGIRARGCRATGTAAWPHRTSLFSTSTSRPANRTKRCHRSTRAKLWAAVGCAGPTAPSTPKPAPATRSKATASPTACSASCAIRAGWALPDRTQRYFPWHWSRLC
jgi:ParB-like chromosome segregation protein Spo0J